MAKTSRKIRTKRSRASAQHRKFSTRIERRCLKCGRNHGYMRDFELCRICFRELANSGHIPGIRKASW
ncbi:MAG: type Z 30S ribosomal protein S14 [Candidatus Kerfeldbacteria bacterium]|nr:type Z 30S ribosomal protein S14 [Candidatus Kerfeldbacteria bacterium]